jgi:hypothetical protein
MILGDDKAVFAQRLNGMGEWYDDPSYDPYAEAAAAQAIDDAQAAADAQAYADQQAADAAYAIDAAQTATDAQDYANAQAAAAQAIDDAQMAQDYADAKAAAAAATYTYTPPSDSVLAAKQALAVAQQNADIATAAAGGNAATNPYWNTPTATPPASTSSNGLWALLFGTPKVTATPTDQPRAQPGQTSVPGYFPSSIPAAQYNPATVYRDANGKVVRYVPETTLTGQIVYRPATGTLPSGSRPTTAPGQSVSVAGFSGSTGILVIGALAAYALISSKG